MRGRDKDGLGTDPVHVDADARLHVVQVDVAVLGDQVNHSVLFAHLYSKKQNRIRISSLIAFQCVVKILVEISILFYSTYQSNKDQANQYE